MRRARFFVTGLLGSALVVGCANDDTGGDTPSATTSTTGGGPSGSTAAASATDSAPTMGTTSPSGTTGDPCSFLNCGDYPKPECDIFAQDCPEGQKCAAYADDGGQSWTNIKCVEVTGMDKPGEACTTADILTGSDSCVEGARCWWVVEGVGTCIAQCTGSEAAPVCAPESICLIDAQSVLNLCSPICDPLLQDCAGPATACHPAYGYDTFLCGLDRSGDAGQANDACEYDGLCDPGLVCLHRTAVSASCEAVPGSGCCTPFCKFPEGACPNPDQVCVQWFDAMQLPEDAPPSDIGVCAIPG